MLESKGGNRLNRNRTVENEKAFKKQGNKRVTLLRETKHSYYQNLDFKDLGDSRKFWKTVKPDFSGKVQTSTGVTLLVNEKVLTDDKAIAEVFNDYFVNIKNSIDIDKVDLKLLSTDGIENSVDFAMTKYSLHPSVQKIQENVHHDKVFALTPVSLEDVNNQLCRLEPKKATHLDSIP